MLQRLLSFAADLSDLFSRRDIPKSEQWRLLIAFLSLHFQWKDIRFLGFAIHATSRVNAIGILKEVFLRGDYACTALPQSPVIIDAGGNVGIATLFFKRYFPASKVTVVEPAAENHRLLLKNVSHNRLSDVRVVRGALGTDESERTFFFNARNPGGSTVVATVVASKTAALFCEERVPGVQLSRLIDGPVDLLKLDIEGAEYEVLCEVERSGKLGLIRQIVMECHANESNREFRPQDMLALLERNGFSTVVYDNERGAYGRRLSPQFVYHFMIRAYRIPH